MEPSKQRYPLEQYVNLGWTFKQQHDITRCALISLTNAHYMHISSFYESTIYSIGNPIAIVIAHSCPIFIDESQRVASLYPFHAAMRSLNTLTICATFCTILYTYIFKKEGILYTFPLVMDARFGLLSCPTDAATKVAIPR
eukprot:253820_1